MNQRVPPGTINLVPIFFLRGVDPLEVKSLYEAGYFETAELRPTNVNAVDLTKVTTQTYGKDAFSPQYSFQDRSSIPIVMCTTNIAAFDYFNKTGGKLLEGGRCDWCKQDFTGRRFGEVVKFEEVSLLIKGVNGEYQRELRPTFWIDGCCHSYRCALAEIQNRMLKPARQREPDLNKKEMYLRHMYYLETGRQDLRAAPDPSLHHANGGPLSDEEYNGSEIQYLPSREILCIPAKPEYLAMRIG